MNCSLLSEFNYESWGVVEEVRISYLRRQTVVKIFRRKQTRMKKILIATLGLGIALGTISFTFAQGDDAKKEGGKKGEGKKGKKDTAETK